MNDSRQQNPTHVASSGTLPLAASAAQPSVELDIEQLVLHGFPSQDRQGIAAAVQSELTRLIAERVPASLTTEASLGQLDAGDFQLSPNTRAETVGVRIAQSIYRGMSQ